MKDVLNRKKYLHQGLRQRKAWLGLEIDQNLTKYCD